MENSAWPDKTIPVISVPQIVPSQRCLRCEVCCRFPEPHSPYRPFFSEVEIQKAIEMGIDPSHFPNFAGSQVKPVPNPVGEGYLCPAFDPETSYCRIYNVRPLDCQIYPFVVMWDEEQRVVNLGWDLKCPFLMEQYSSPETNNGTRADIPQFSGFPETLHPFIPAMARRIESPDMLNILSGNPQLVMAYQNDVVVLQTLPLLTKRIAES